MNARSRDAAAPDRGLDAGGMDARGFDAIVLDVDGTLLNDDGVIPERTRRALAAARSRGVVVMLATGRSERACREVARELELDAPCIVYNGAGLYDPKGDRMLERRELPQRAVVRMLGFAERHGILAVVARPEGQYVPAPRNGHQQRVLNDFRNARRSAPFSFPTFGAQRVTVLSEYHASSRTLLTDVMRTLDTPAHLTHFDLNQLAHFRDSHMRVVDVQAHCRGKSEALVALQQRYGIPRARVVAVGDADNDVEILRDAGLGVAMGNATIGAVAVADRQIGNNTSDALGALVEELFG